MKRVLAPLVHTEGTPQGDVTAPVAKPAKACTRAWHELPRRPLNVRVVEAVEAVGR